MKKYSVSLIVKEMKKNMLSYFVVNIVPFRPLFQYKDAILQV